MESLAESETPFEMTELSSGSILFNILAMTENSRPKPDFLVETNSSETPPPSTPETRQLIAERLFGDAGSKGRMRRWWENGCCGGRKVGLSDKSAARERTALAAAEPAIYRQYFPSILGVFRRPCAGRENSLLPLTF